MLSIIIPTYNEEKYLPRLLESIKRQDYTDYEIIVADARSKDNTVKIARSYGAKVVAGGMPAVGRNKGAAAAKGDMLLFLDSDLVLTPRYLTQAVKDFKKKKLAVAITHVMPLSKKAIDRLMFDFSYFFMITTQYIKPHGSGCQGILTTKALHDRIKGFDESMDFGEDVDYIERIGKHGKFRVLAKPLLFCSIRRLEKEGRINFSLCYTKSTLCQFAGRKVSAADVNYTFGYNCLKKK